MPRLGLLILVLVDNYFPNDASDWDNLISVLCVCAGVPMGEKNRFKALEAMCREKAAQAEREMKYWLDEANE